MTTNAHELSSSVGAWNAVVRRARIGRERKAAALVVSSYANANGTGIHCGVARLAVDLEVSYSTARRYLAWLREVGLIELVRAGNRQRNRSDEYRLILGPHVLEEVEVLDPAAHNALTDSMREANRAGSKKRSASAALRSSKVSAEMPQEDEALRSPRASAENGALRSNGTRSALTQDERPPRLYTSPRRPTSPKTTDVEVLGGPVTLQTPEEPAVVVEIRPGISQEAPYRPTPRWASRSQDTIAEASARVAARKAAHAAGQQPPATTTEVS